MTAQSTPTPWRIGSKKEYGTYNASVIFDANGDAVCQVYGIPQNATVEESEKLKSAKVGLGNAALIVRAVNGYGPMVEALKRIAKSGEFTCFNDAAWDEVNAALKLAGVE